MRTFIALEIPLSPNSLMLLGNLKQSLSNNKIRWVNLNTLHLTLFFLGETNALQVKSVESVFRDYASQFAPVELTVKGAGTFGHKANPKVLWLGVEGNEALHDLHTIINKKVEPIGFAPDKRGFNPHITVGRIKDVSSLCDFYDSVSSFKGVTFQHSLIEKITFYKSTLTPSGAMYTPIAEQRLMG